MSRGQYKDYKVMQHVTTKDNEGNTIHEYKYIVGIVDTNGNLIEDSEGNTLQAYKDGLLDDTPNTVNAYIYPAGGKVQSEIYGDRLKYIRNMIYKGKTVLKENDVIYIDDEKAKYKILAIKPYSKHKELELERLHE